MLLRLVLTLLVGLGLGACERGPESGDLERIVTERLSQAVPDGGVKLTSLNPQGHGPLASGEAGEARGIA